MSRRSAISAQGQNSASTTCRPHQPQRTLLYQLIEQHYPAFIEHLAGQGIELPYYVRKEFDNYLNIVWVRFDPLNCPIYSPKEDGVNYRSNRNHCFPDWSSASVGFRTKAIK